MNIENLKIYIETINNKINNYRSLCSLLEEDIKSGSSKIAQLKEINRHIKFHKEANSFIIDKIYDEPLEKIDNRKNNGTSKGSKNNNRIINPNFLITIEDENKIGIYKIVLNNNIYIGSTIAGFRHRFIQHNNEKFNNVPFTSSMLKDGATFEILKICNGMTEPQIREKENEYINLYKNSKDWNIINIKDAWSFVKKQKYKTIKLQVKKEDYEKTLRLLQENNLI